MEQAMGPVLQALKATLPPSSPAILALAAHSHAASAMLTLLALPCLLCCPGQCCDCTLGEHLLFASSTAIFGIEDQQLPIV